MAFKEFLPIIAILAPPLVGSLVFGPDGAKYGAAVSLLSLLGVFGWALVKDYGALGALGGVGKGVAIIIVTGVVLSVGKCVFHQSSYEQENWQDKIR